MKQIERIIILVYLIYPIRFFVSASIDNGHLIDAFNGERVWVNDSNYETYVAYFIYSIIIFLLFVHYSRNFLLIRFHWLDLIIFLFFLAGVIHNFRHWPLTEVVGIILFFAILFALRNVKIEFSFIRRLVSTHLVVMAMIIVFSILNFDRSFSPCTRDKCSIVGSLFTSFFPHENALALYLLIGSIFFLIKKSIFGYIFFSVHGALILMTGSRLVIIALFFVLFFSFFRIQVIYTLTWIVVISSGLLFFANLDPSALTGRGLIFSVGREYFLNNIFFGFGYGALTDASFFSGIISYRVSHEHNGIGALLIRHGILGGIAFVIFLWQFGTRLVSRMNLQVLFLLVLVLTFPTESNSDFSIQNTFAWVYLFISAQFFDEKPRNYVNNSDN